MTPKRELSGTIKGPNGKPVEILGFMDVVLPRDGMQFMLLREPRFVCPFHDVGYDWAGFASVLLNRPTDDIDGPLRIAARIDIGETLDEMGLVSYVRVYAGAIERA